MVPGVFKIISHRNNLKCVTQNNTANYKSRLHLLSPYPWNPYIVTVCLLSCWVGCKYSTDTANLRQSHGTPENIPARKTRFETS